MPARRDGFRLAASPARATMSEAPNPVNPRLPGVVEQAEPPPPVARPKTPWVDDAALAVVPPCPEIPGDPAFPLVCPEPPADPPFPAVVDPPFPAVVDPPVPAVVDPPVPAVVDPPVPAVPAAPPFPPGSVIHFPAEQTFPSGQVTPSQETEKQYPLLHSKPPGQGNSPDLQGSTH